MKHLAAAHGELHVRSGCDSPWRDTSGEHSNRRTSVPFRSNMAERAVVPHVAADADDVPRRGGWQAHARPGALVLRPAPRPNAMSHSRMASGSHRRARAARLNMKRPRSVMPSARKLGHPHHVVLPPPALQSRYRRFGAASVAGHVGVVDRPVAGCWGGGAQPIRLRPCNRPNSVVS